MLALFAAAQPVGVILVSGGASLLRTNTITPVMVQVGDLIFRGDVLRTRSSRAAFLFCPAKLAQSVAPSTEVMFEEFALKVRSGTLVENRPVNACSLPILVRLSVASQQRYGGFSVRLLGF
jgi:hypothetical protein